MNTRKVTIYVYSYPADFWGTLSLKRILETPEVLEYIDNFISDRSLEELLVSYIDKVDVYASLVDDIRCYRIVIKDNERNIFTIHKA